MRGGCGRVSLWFLLAASPGCADPGEKACDSDGDCKAAQCCHATDAVNAAHAPECAEVMCTQEYRACTTDDSSIRPACQAGQCNLTLPPWCPLVQQAD